MRKLLYLLCEMLVLYALAACGGLLFLWLTVGFESLTGKILAIVNMVVMVPFAIRGVLIGFTNRSFAQSVALGAYRPFRLIAWLMPVFQMAQDHSDLPGFGNRQSLYFPLNPSGRGDAYDVISALSTYLDREGITHTSMGNLMVRDNAATWQLRPSTQSEAIEGWVEARDPKDRAQVIDGLRAFLASVGHLSPA